MYVGMARISLTLAGAHSLKEKRMVIRRIKDRVRERLGVFVSEVGSPGVKDAWQRSELGVAVASGDRQKALALIDEVIRVAMAAGGAIIVGFHVRPAGKSSKHAEQEGVEIRLYDIIYDALDDVKAAMAGLLATIKREVAMGKLAVRDTFSIPKMGTVAGCMVTEGKVTRKAHLRIIRDAVQVYEGKVGSLRRFKDDVSEVQQGYECGVMIAGWNEIKQNDVIEAYEVIEEAAQL